MFMQSFIQMEVWWGTFLGKKTTHLTLNVCVGMLLSPYFFLTMWSVLSLPVCSSVQFRVRMTKNGGVTRPGAWRLVLFFFFFFFSWCYANPNLLLSLAMHWCSTMYVQCLFLLWFFFSARSSILCNKLLCLCKSNSQQEERGGKGISYYVCT